MGFKKNINLINDFLKILREEIFILYVIVPPTQERQRGELYKLDNRVVEIYTV